MHAIPRHPRRRAAVAALTCLLLALGALLAAAAAAKTSHSPKTACAGAAHAARHARHSSASRCAKAKAKARTRKPGKGARAKRSAGKHAAKPGATVVFLTPATCEDETTPTRAADGSYACDDGSEPTCEDGSAPVRLSGTGQPMCRLSPGQASEGQEAQCEGQSGECATVEWACEGEQEGSSASQNCETGGEDDSGEPQG